MNPEQTTKHLIWSIKKKIGKWKKAKGGGTTHPINCSKTSLCKLVASSKSTFMDDKKNLYSENV